MSGKSNTGAKSLRTRRRRLLALPVLALLVVAIAATTAFARGGAVTWPTEAQETATSGVFTNLPFCPRMNECEWSMVRPGISIS